MKERKINSERKKERKKEEERKIDREKKRTRERVCVCDINRARGKAVSYFRVLFCLSAVCSSLLRATYFSSKLQEDLNQPSRLKMHLT